MGGMLERTPLIFVLLAVLLADTSLGAASEPPLSSNLVMRYRHLTSRDCTVFFADSGSDSHEDRWEGRIERHLEQIRDHLESLGKSDPHSLRRLRFIQASVTSEDSRFNTLFPYADLLHNPTHRRWRWLTETLGFRVTTLSISDISRLGHQSEFAPMSVDMEKRRLRLNLNFEFDAWLESLQARDVADPDTVAVYAVAEAYFRAQTGTPPHYAYPHEKFMSQIVFELAKHDSLKDTFRSLFSDQADWQEELITQTWIFLMERFALREAYQFYRKRRGLEPKPYLQRMEELVTATESKRDSLMGRWLSARYYLEPELIETLWGYEPRVITEEP